MTYFNVCSDISFGMNPQLWVKYYNNCSTKTALALSIARWLICH